MGQDQMFLHSPQRPVCIKTHALFFDLSSSAFVSVRFAITCAYRASVLGWVGLYWVTLHCLTLASAVNSCSGSGRSLVSPRGSFGMTEVRMSKGALLCR